MTRLTPKFAIAISTAALLASGAAYAQTAERGGDRTRAQVTERTAARFARMDANGDGQIDAQDREARALARFDRMDADGDDTISRAEYAAHLEARGERREQRAERRSERREARGARSGGERMARRGGNRGAAMLRRADTNNDGALTLAEFQSRALTKFDRVDADGNGTVTAAERADRAAERQQRRESRQQRRGS